MTIKFKISEIRPRIFFLNFKDTYNMSMHFLRYQEYYESPSSKFRGKSFYIVDFIEWYSKKFGNGIFTYPSDWVGFNIPGHIIKDVWNLGIFDKNNYDFNMKNIYNYCCDKYPDNIFYIIGAVGVKSESLKHEIAHGFFYINPEYRKTMIKLVKKLQPNFRKSLNQMLKKSGYTSKVYIDECQAYLSTGLSKIFETDIKNEQKPFVKLYYKFYNKK